MSAPAEETKLETMLGQADVVKIHDSELSFHSPLMDDLPRALRAFAELLKYVEDKGEDPTKERAKWEWMLIAANSMGPVRELITCFTSLTTEEAGKLSIEKLLDVALEIVKRNLDFFLGALMPAIMKIQKLATSASTGARSFQE